jgi:hypothetical protein
MTSKVQAVPLQGVLVAAVSKGMAPVSEEARMPGAQAARCLDLQVPPETLPRPIQIEELDGVALPSFSTPHHGLFIQVCLSVCLSWEMAPCCLRRFAGEPVHLQWQHGGFHGVPVPRCLPLFLQEQDSLVRPSIHPSICQSVSLSVCLSHSSFPAKTS